jgi:tetratricopeptide (TPR) repeat protein
MKPSVLLVAGLIALAGCETEVVVHIKPHGRVGESFEPKVTNEKKLLDRTEKDPRDPKVWFELGDYYESGLELDKAVAAYEHGNDLLEPGRYTGGHYVLARIYLRLQEYDRSIAHLAEIFKLEPKDPSSAILNPHFREAHYLRGAIYYLSEQHRPAKREFERFMALGGSEGRVEEWLDKIQIAGD